MTKSEHLLTCLSEECAEVIQAVSKALRFGLCESCIGYADGLSNVEAIVKELHDVIAVVEMLEDEKIIEKPINKSMLEAKKAKVRKMMEHARRNGAMSEVPQ